MKHLQAKYRLWRYFACKYAKQNIAFGDTSLSVAVCERQAALHSAFGRTSQTAIRGK
ncbi:MAG: hypothetical protein FWC01_06905 [Treponema sp.]|nr:hypothetical protein [Treponema sp.]